MTKTDASAAVRGPQGVQGWLLAMCLMFVVFGPAISARLAAHDCAELAPYFNESGGILAAALLMVALRVLAVGYGIHAGLLLWAVRPNAVATAKRSLLLALAAEIAITLIAWAADPDVALTPQLPAQLVVQIAPGLVFFTICFAYLNRSERVAATYASTDA